MSRENVTNCPLCGGSSGVLESRDKGLIAGMHARRRRRNCNVCGEKFTTYELSKTSFLSMYSIVKEVEAIMEKQKLEKIRESIDGLIKIAQNQPSNN